MRETLINKIHKLKKYFDDGSIPRLAQHEVNPNLLRNDRLNYLYFTLPVSINFQRNSPAMWQSALQTFNDPETNYLFYPEKVVLFDRSKIQKNLVKHKLGLQKNKHTDIWIAISKTMMNEFNADPRELFKKHNFDVGEILNTIRITEKKKFPYLSGAKMTNYWLYILSHYTDVKLKNMNLISIIPDTHVMKSSIELGIIKKEIDREKLAELWEEILDGSELLPVDMHPVLWNWSRNKFQPSV